MKELVLSLLAFGVAVVMLAAPQPDPDRCTANVDNVGSRVQDGRFVTMWQVEHDAGGSRLATVYFTYTINYVTENGMKQVASGVFRRVVLGQSMRYAKESIPSVSPFAIVSVDYGDIICAK